ncbi:MAG: hypothetical protein BWK80_50155 [Desulfobacteraceae bacterium IS3]|nr:MAG: hypothetical protein BWK80_50155 [Desulfobacteraceae bacterium IS3]
MDMFGNNIALSAGSVIAALLGSISPWFMLLAIIGVLYLSRGTVRLAIRDIKNKRYISAFVVSW